MDPGRNLLFPRHVFEFEGDRSITGFRVLEICAHLHNDVQRGVRDGETDVAPLQPLRNRRRLRVAEVESVLKLIQEDEGAHQLLPARGDREFCGDNRLSVIFRGYTLHPTPYTLNPTSYTTSQR